MKILTITIMLLFLNSAIAENHNDHSTHLKKEAKKFHLDKKFKPTEELKSYMEKILKLVKELKDKTKDSKEVARYGNLITETVNDLFKTCKLEQEADAAIHPSLGLILSGATDFKKGDYKTGHSNARSGPWRPLIPVA